jgi:uncharacterized protein
MIRTFESEIPIEQRLAKVDWITVEQEIDAYGYAKIPKLLTPQECADLIALYDQPTLFRTTVNMERAGFGVGEYKYFTNPLPPLVQDLRASMYPILVNIANRWMEELSLSVRYETTFPEFIARCAKRGQLKPTPLLLRYETDGYNNLHQDIYGPITFPLQMTFALSRLGEDYEGGEFLLLEQQPRSQWRGSSISLNQGEAIIFATRDRPAIGRVGYHKANMRHGVSRLISGKRYTLGIIFHDAE